MTKKTLTRVVVIAVVLTAVSLAALILISSKAPAAPPLPTPNGYDDFMKAGSLVAGLNDNAATMNLASLRTQVAANAEGLRVARQGFQRECRVPLQFTTEFMNSHVAMLANIKRLAQSFFAEGKLAEREGRCAEAARAYLDAIQLGRDGTQGGMIIDELVGVACEAIGTAGLQNVKGSLNAAECREAIRRLEAVDTKAQPISEAWQRDKAWGRRTYPIRGWIYSVISFQETQRTEQMTRAKAETSQLTRRRLLLDLASRACELEKGAPPKAAADLVPDYLKAVPNNPTTGTNLVLSPQR
jgi:hypothetical protein